MLLLSKFRIENKNAKKTCQDPFGSTKHLLFNKVSTRKKKKTHTGESKKITLTTAPYQQTTSIQEMLLVTMLYVHANTTISKPKWTNLVYWSTWQYLKRNDHVPLHYVWLRERSPHRMSHQQLQQQQRPCQKQPTS